MNKYKKNPEEDPLKEILKGTKRMAGENLKYRIMQQIETERTFAPTKIKNNIPLIKNMLSIFGIMYAIIAVFGFGIYFTTGKESLESITFLLPVILIASVCSIFWMITMYDERRRSKHH